jgi:hypothetical protein
MYILNVNDKEYKIKFGYKALSKSNVLQDVIALENVTDESDISVINELFGVLANLVLAGLQKFNDEYKVDYDSPQSIKEGLEKVYDLLDDYADDENSNDIYTLLNELVNELTNNGFLAQPQAQTEEPVENAKTEIKKK